jgi:thiol:disulfide interchange protein DsbC
MTGNLMKRSLLVLTHVLALIACGALAISLAGCKPAQGTIAEATGTDMQALRANLSTRLGREIDPAHIAPAALPGLFEVQLGAEIIYTDAKGDFYFVGDMVDARTRENLTRARVAELTRIEFNALPLALAQKQVKGKGERSLAVFADPNCGYCKRLEHTLESVDNITIYTFYMPVLGEDSMLKARQIWCARDRQEIWAGWMLRGQLPMGAGDCATPINEVLAFADKQGIHGTPALFFADGKRHAGAMQLAELEQELLGAQQRAAQKN